MIELSKRLANLSPAKRMLLEQRLKKRPDVAEPIAVVGMACRFPGAPNLDEYWRLIDEGRQATGEIPSSRWDIDEFYDPTGEIDGKMSTRWGGFLEDADHFDPLFFGITPREACRMDPQQRLILEVAWQALEHGGLAPEQLSGSITGVFIGIGATDYSKIPSQYENYYEHIDAHSGTGNALSISANRLSYLFDFRGPSLAVDTACSSGLVGIHLAQQSLRQRECNLAVAGGVNMILSPETTIAFSQARMLSADGVCRPFDEKANGYVRGEGCGIVVLKRLTDATRDGDSILAVLRGSAVNQDGRTSGLTAPNAISQQKVIRAALAQAGISPVRVSYVEAHGTGTPLGDPIEIQALGSVFRRRSKDDQPCHVTSVKANIGHLETASGIAGLIKTVLMLHHRKIVPQLHLQSLNQNLSLEDTRLLIPSEALDWPSDGRTRVAGVSSFGFGGANAHIVVEEASPAEIIPPEEDRPLHLLALSAKTSTALRSIAAQYVRTFQRDPMLSVADVCYSANTGRSHFNHRVAVIGQKRDTMIEQLQLVAEGKVAKSAKVAQVRLARRPQLAFLFTGQGSQYVNMGRGLYEGLPAFRRTINQCDEALSDILGKSLMSVLYPDGSDSPLDETAFTQPALFAIEYALAELWRSWGVEPSVVMGHSVGEYVAACVAGVFSFEDGLQLIAHRARLMQQLPQDGLMAVVFANRSRVEPPLEFCRDRVSVAAQNGPDNTVISGDAESVRAMVEKLEEDGISSKMLTVSHAFHSPLMEPMLDEFTRLADRFEYHAPRVPLVSNLTGRVFEDQIPDSDYWRQHIRNTVRFSEGIHSLVEQDVDAVLEIGPTASLLGMARRCLPESDATWVPSLRKGQEDWRVMYDGLASLYRIGQSVNWAGFDADWRRNRIPLPGYPFERSRHWYKDSRRWDAGSHGGLRGSMVHPLLGSRVAAPGQQASFESRFSAQSPNYLADHQVQGSAVTPAAAYLEQGFAAADQVFGPGRHGLENVSIQQAMFLPDGMSRAVHIAVSPESGGQCTYETYSTIVQTEQDQDKPAWTMHACGTLRHEDLHEPEGDERIIDLDEIRSRVVARSNREEFYEQIAERGLSYGPSFQVLDQMERTDRDALALIRLPEDVIKQSADYHLHPALWDACFQSMAGAVPLEADGSYSPYTYMPTAVRRVRIHAPLAERMVSYSTRTSQENHPSPETVEGDILLLDEEGRVLVEMLGVCVQRLGRSQQHQQEEVRARDWLYQVQWVEQPLLSQPDDPKQMNSRSETLPAGDWLIFADESGVAEALAARIKERGASAVLIRPFPQQDATTATGEDIARQIDPLSGENIETLLDELFTKRDRDCAGVIHAWSLDIADPGQAGDAELDRARRLGCGSVLRLIQQLARHRFSQTPALWLVTAGAQSSGQNDSAVSVAQAPLWGMGRVAAMEHPELRCRLVDLDSSSEVVESADVLIGELAHEGDEQQVAFFNGRRHVARLQPAPDALPDDRVDQGGAMTLPGDADFQLRIGTPGSFDSLRFVAFDRPQPAAGQVEIQVRAAGLNFSDVLKAMGLYPGIRDEIVPLGIECSGLVTRVGDKVDRFQVGDEVLGVAPYSFSSHAITADYALVHKPAGLDHAQACTIPITFLTAYYALTRLAQLQPKERLLIHAGAGGVGLAAIQIAQHLGAEIFTTAGSDEKREYLRSLGVEHVMNSRTLDFAEQINEITGREGVDVVLNSLPGDAIPASLSVLRAYGRFLEIGKTDIYQNRMIGLSPFQDNLSYFAIDLDRMLRQRSEYIHNLFTEVMEHFDSGVFQPLALTQFSIADTVGAFRYMAQRKNIGKVVVSLSDRPDPAPAERTPRVTVRRDGTYLITGGSGALGLRVADWMASQGAGALLLMSRSTPSGDAARSIDKLRQSGLQVAVVQGDVTDRQSLRSALDEVPGDFPSLRGVVHAAGVLDDGVMYDMDLDQLDRAMVPKVQGAWNLHSATREDPLDFFVLFSSVASVLGSPGQANYAAGNAFLDSLADYRRTIGLPATSINWGPWAGSGMAATSDRSEQIKSRGMDLIPPDQGLEILEGILPTKRSNITVMDVHWSDMFRLLARRQPSLLKDIARDEQDSANSGPATQIDQQLRIDLLAADEDRRKTMLSEYFAGELANIMGIDDSELDHNQPLNDLGLDSLMAMELKNKIEGRLEINLPMARFLEGPSVTALAEIAAGLLVEEGDSEASSGGPSSDQKQRSILLPLQPHGDLPAVFCVHPAGGDVRCYLDLAKQIGSERPVYALRARGMEGDEPPHASVTEMATDYVSAIRTAQPDGPYHLAGWSTGGIFAYEVARRLLDEGADLGSVVFFDSPTPSIMQDVDLTDDAKFLFDLVNFSNWFAGASMSVNYEQLRSQDPKQRLRTVLAELQDHNVVPQDVMPQHVGWLIDVCRSHVRAIQGYDLHSIDHPIYIIRPETLGVLAEASGQQVAADLGWGSVVSDQLRMHETPGDHFSMMTGEHASRLAQLLNDCLEEGAWQ